MAQTDFQHGNYYKAFDSLHPYAERGDKDAQYAVGYMYYYGLGTAKDQNTARYWIRKSAEQGKPAAQHAMYEITHDALQYSAAQAGVKNDTVIPIAPIKPAPSMPAPKKSVSKNSKPSTKPLTFNNDSEWIQHQSPQNYTIKLASLKSTPHPKEKIEHELGLKDTKQYQFKKEGETWMAVITGSYRRHIDAEHMMLTLPLSFRTSAQIIAFSQIQKRMS